MVFELEIYRRVWWIGVLGGIYYGKEKVIDFRDRNELVGFGGRCWCISMVLDFVTFIGI